MTVPRREETLDTFATERLIAERFREEHLADLVGLHLDPVVSRYLGGVRSPEATAAYLAAGLAHWHRHGFGIWAWRTQAGEFAGRAGIRHATIEGAQEFEIVYTIRRELWSKGFASEIVAALVGVARARLGMPSLVGLVVAGNDASCRILERSGFARERTMLSSGEEVELFRLAMRGA